MNKPDLFKKILEVDQSYCNLLLKIFDNDYDPDHKNFYGRPNIFKKVDCDFTVDRFIIKNKNKYEKFIHNSKKLLDTLYDFYGPGKISSLQIAKMQGGGIIHPHIDCGLEFVFSHRIHIPLITNNNVIFEIDSKEFYFSLGNVYEINNLKEHGVKNKNNPSFYRKHLILDYMSDEYIHFLSERSNCSKKFFNYL